MSKDYSIGVITNDIYTKEDAEFLHKNSILPMERIVGVETGGCPHTAIREDASMNLEAVDELANKFLDLDIIFIESGGDNLSATFSPELSDATIFVIDVAEGDKIPRKGGPGNTGSDNTNSDKTGALITPKATPSAGSGSASTTDPVTTTSPKESESTSPSKDSTVMPSATPSATPFATPKVVGNSDLSVTTTTVSNKENHAIRIPSV